MLRPIATLLAAVLLCSAAGRADAEVTDTPTHRQLSLPSAATKLALPLGDWVITQERRRPDGNGVYYVLESAQRKLIFSVFIEKTAICNGANACLALAMKNPSYKEAKDLKTLEIGSFSANQFYLDKPQGLPIMQAHLLASTYVDGQWFDVHISKGGSELPDQSLLVELPKEITIK
jgi:hypothetical protein